MEDAEIIAASIRCTRKHVGITQADLAQLAGISQWTVRAIETGTGNPSLAAVVTAADVLGLHLAVE